MHDALEFEDCARRLKALADSERLRIVEALFAGEKNVSELAEELGEEVVNVSHHLGVLKNAGLVHSQRNGRFIIYSLAREVLKSVAAAGLGLGLARIGLGSASAKGKNKKKKKAVGVRCSKNDQCGGLQCKVSNSQQSCYPENEKRCCKPIGAKCDDGCECCGIDVICNGGYCQGA